MSNTEDLAKKIDQPKVVEIDNQKVTQHSLKEVAEFDRYIQGKKAIKKRGSGLKFTKMEASGA